MFFIFLSEDSFSLFFRPYFRDSFLFGFKRKLNISFVMLFAAATWLPFLFSRTSRFLPRICRAQVFDWLPGTVEAGAAAGVAATSAAAAAVAAATATSKKC